MSTKKYTHKLTLNKVTDEHIINSEEWKFIGYFGTCFIFGRYNKRCLVDPNTGKVSFEYETTMRDTGRSVKRRSKNVKL